jgi:phosphoribosylaminoimidazole (AIR) synthetase
MREEGPVDIEESYKTWNMGVGWVIYAPSSEGGKISKACGEFGIQTYELGYVEDGEREVFIKPFDITYAPKKAA